MGMDTIPESATSGRDVDLATIGRVIGGDRASFEALYTKYVKRLYNLAFRVVGSHEEAEEVTQEAFYQIYRSLPKFKAESLFYTWIYRITSNCALHHVKKRMRARLGSLQNVALAPRVPVTEGTASPEQVAEARELYLAIDQHIRALPPNQRVVMVLGPIQGHSYEQMAQITGTNADVVKGRLHRARRNMREALASCDLPRHDHARLPLG